MFRIGFNPTDSWRAVIRRKVGLLHRVAQSILRPGERLETLLHADGLGVQIDVVSSNPKALLNAIKEQAFPQYSLLWFSDHGHQGTAHFRAL